ncbi:MAG: thiamine-phosphate kinase [Phycisphaerae bacterium]|jgi:thiamine-monophosphate kinase|nr:thiamine-phosphate kinase [Phycisphaerae bacterium]MDP7288650.1 thiamine-phosphate kinase [Phycisphaerae bacterium]
MRELEFIDWIQGRSDFDATKVPVGPGDDCAIVRLGDKNLLVTTDQLLDGVHIILAEHGARAAGRKVIARSLSDIAAMAAIPLAAVATATLPRDFPESEAQELYRGMREIADEYHCPLVGGDVATWDGPLCLTSTIFGRRAGVTGGIEPILRSGAMVGDAVCVTGMLGGAWKSSKHLEFQPRVAQGVELAISCRLRSMIDISDSLARDLQHICTASGVGAEIVAADVPVNPDLAGDPAAALHAALHDGEDYELLFTVSQAWARKLISRQPLSVPITRIGTIVADAGLTLISADGSRNKLEPIGWEHGV